VRNKQSGDVRIIKRTRQGKKYETTLLKQKKSIASKKISNAFNAFVQLSHMSSTLGCTASTFVEVVARVPLH